ncbi:MAG: class I SAM-dependent methyltransferase [Phycisphaerales bacterium]
MSTATQEHATSSPAPPAPPAALSNSAAGLMADVHARFGPVLTCPKCHGAVRPTGDDRGLECASSCGAGMVAAAREGVLDFVAVERDDRGDQAGFGYQWEKVLRGKLDEQIVYNNTPEDLWNGLDKWLKLGGNVKGLRALDVGCGHGQYCRVLADHGATAMGCDLSEVVYRATAENVRGGKVRDTAFLRTDVLRFPIADHAFDIVLSIGIAHHTPDTRAAVLAAARCVKPGGKMLLYIYELGAGGVGYITLRHTFTLPGKLPRPLMLLSCKLMSLPLAFYLAGRQRKLPRGRTFQAAYLGLVDAYLPKYSFRHRPEECMGWLKEAGLSDVERPWPCFFYGRRPV